MATQSSVVVLVKKPGSVAKMCSNASGSGIYASSPDGRFVVWVRRRMVGDKGRREYAYSFDAIDRNVPSAGRSYTQIPFMHGSTTHDAKKVYDAIARYVSGLKE